MKKLIGFSKFKKRNKVQEIGETKQQMNTARKMRNNDGITLVSVLTMIIIILILASFAISGGLGILKNSKESNKEENYAAVKAAISRISLNEGMEGVFTPASDETYGKPVNDVFEVNDEKLAGWYVLEKEDLENIGVEYVNQSYVVNYAQNKVYGIEEFEEYLNNGEGEVDLGAEVSYTINFLPDDEETVTGTMTPQTFAYGVAQSLKENTYVKEGYHFIAWNTSVDGTGETFTNRQQVKDLSDVDGTTIDFYTMWAINNYKVKFNANGGIGLMNDQEFTYNLAEELADNEFIRTGYTFTGWNTSANGNGRSYSENDLVNNLTKLNDDVVDLYAQWAANTYIVKFNSNGGTGTMTSQEMTYGVEEQLIENAFTRSGYRFAGWNTVANGTGTHYDDKADVKYLATDGEITLYAQWRKDVYVIRFNPNGGNGSMTNQEIPYDTPTALTENAFTKSGYRFVSWNTNADGSGTRYEDKQEVTNIGIGGSITLYAQWEISNYVVKFNKNGGNGTMADQTFTYDVPQNLSLNTFTRNGYTFAGWNTKADGSGISYNDGASVTNIAPDGEITLYAKWTANDYTITYTLNGGTQATGQPITFTIEDLDVTLLNPTKAGYTFTGWYDNSSFTGSSITKITTIGNKSLFAKWTANEYIVKFNANGGIGSMSDQTFTYDVAQNLTANSYTRTGYSFNGWNTAANGSGTNYDNKASVTNLATSGEVTLYAKWTTNSYTITYILNGGTQAEGQVESFTVEDLDVTLLNPTRNWYTFGGWYDNSSFTGSPITKITTIGNKEFFAKWTANEYTITYTLNGGTQAEGQVESFTVEDLDVTLLNPTRNGYTFGGWYDNSSFTGSPITKITTIGNKEFFAKWTGNEYTVTFDPGDGAIVDTPSKTVTFNNAYGGLPTPRREGYSFDGWYNFIDVGNFSMAAKDTGAAQDNFQYKNLGTVHSGVKYTVTMNSARVTEGTATHFSILVYYFNENRAVVNMQKNFGENLSFVVDVPTGYEDKELSLLIYSGVAGSTRGIGTEFENVVAWTNDMNEFTDNTVVFMPFNHTLKARWTGNSYTVKFNNNGGTGTMSNQTFTYGVAQNLTANSFTRTGYTFNGWNTASDGSGTNYANRASVSNLATSGEVTLYAKWTINALTFEDQTINKTFSTSSQTAEITPATDGTGTYTYSEVSEKNASNTSTNYISISGTTITIAANTPASTYIYVIKATDSGSGATKDATYTVTIAKKAASISYGATSVSKTFGDAAFTNTLTNTGDGAVTYGSSNTSVATIDSNGQVTIVGAGSATITATVTDGTNYTYATKTATYTITVAKAATPTAPTAKSLTYTGSAQELVNAGSNLVTWYYKVGTALTSSNHSSTGSTTIPTGTNAGSYDVYYYTPGNANYSASSGNLKITVTIAKKAASISYATTSVSKTFGDAAFTNTLTNTGDGAVTYGSSNTSVATIDSNGQVTIVGAGSTTITATVTDGTNYTYATKDATYTITVGKQTVNAPTNVVVSTAGRVTWTASSNATGYQISIDGTDWTSATSGVDYLSTIIASTGSRTVYVRAVNSDTANYTTSSSNATKEVTVYAITFASNSTTMGTVSPTSYNVISGATLATSGNNLVIKGVTSGTTTTNLQTITPTAKSGYSFGSWSKTSGSLTSTQTITATFTANTYTITYNLNNGIQAAGQPTSFKVTDLDVTLLSPTRTGYTFAGWYDNAGFTGSSITKITTIGNKVFYAKWTPNTYTVKFNANGGSGTMSNQTFTYDVAQNLTSNSFTRTGYTFNGWNTADNGSGTNYSNGQSVSNLATSGEVTLFAKWAGVPYKVRFNNNGGTGTMPDQDFVYGTAQNLNANTFTKDGYAFDGWNTSNDGTGTNYADGASVNNLVSVANGIFNLYAKWKGKEAYFNGNNSSSYLANVTALDNITRFEKYSGDASTVQTLISNGTAVKIDDNTTDYSIYAWYDNGTVYWWSDASKVYLLDKSHYLWYNLRNATYIDTTGIDVSKVTNMLNMFYFTGYNTGVTSFEIVGLDNWDTSSVTNMSVMFYNTGHRATTWSIGDLSDWDVSGVTTMKCMFSDAGYSATAWSIGDLSDWDTSNVTTMERMFEGVGYNSGTWSIGNLSGWDTSSVTNMSSMFNYAGYSATTWSIGDLSSWDTSSVTNMSSMFNGAGRSATTWSVGDLSGWDTSSVTNMSTMFCAAGNSATTWNIGDLSGWDTSSVTSMGYMFASAGYSATGTWSIGNLSGWDTSSVTNMSYIFSNAGRSATTWNIGNLSGWDTSSVTNMSYMFSNAGYSAGTWSIGDLSGWDTSSVTNMSYMFSSAGYSATTWSIGDLSSWDTSSVTNMSSMFNGAGRSATTWSVGDLSDWDVSNVTNMSSMFYSAGYNSTPFELDLTGWDTSHVTNMGNMFYNCRKLTTIYASNSFVTTALTSTNNSMFSGCSSLVGSAGTAYSSSHTGADYAHIDGGVSNPGYFSDRSTYTVEYYDGANLLGTSSLPVSGTHNLKTMAVLGGNPNGDTFVGWTTTSNALTADYTDGQGVSALAGVGGTVQLYSVYSKVITVTYYITTAVPRTQTVTRTQYYNLNGASTHLTISLLNVTEKNAAGDIFAGWCSDSETTIYVGRAGTVIDPLTEDKEYYSLWQHIDPEQITVTKVSSTQLRFDHVPDNVTIEAWTPDRYKADKQVNPLYVERNSSSPNVSFNTNNMTGNDNSVTVTPSSRPTTNGFTDIYMRLTDSYGNVYTLYYANVKSVTTDTFELNTFTGEDPYILSVTKGTTSNTEHTPSPSIGADGTINLDLAFKTTSSSSAKYNASYTITIMNDSSQDVEFYRPTYIPHVTCNKDNGNYDNYITYSISGIADGSIIPIGESSSFNITFTFTNPKTSSSGVNNIYYVDQGVGIDFTGGLTSDSGVTTEIITNTGDLSGSNTYAEYTIRVTNDNIISKSFNISILESTKFNVYDENGNTPRFTVGELASGDFVIRIEKVDGTEFVSSPQQINILFTVDGDETKNIGIVTATVDVSETFYDFNPPIISNVKMEISNTVGEVNITWDGYDEEDAVLKYHINLYKGDGTFVDDYETADYNTGYTLTGLTNKEEYYVIVYGEDSSNNVPDSSTISGATTSSGYACKSEPVEAGWVFDVTIHATDVTYSNAPSTINRGDTFEVAFTRSNNTWNSPTVKMGGETITSYSFSTSNATETMTITNVTGDLDITVSSYSWCLAEGTQILMADGTYKNVEDVEYTDLLTVYDHVNGKLTNVYPIWIEQQGESNYYEKITFSDGSDLKVVGNHNLFGVDNNRYINANDENECSIGTRVYKVVDGKLEIVTITNIEYIDEEIKYYNVVSAIHYNVIANDLLTTDPTSSISNVYGFEDNAVYGDNYYVLDTQYQLTYEDCNFVPHYLFKGLNLKNIATLIGNVLDVSFLEDFVGRRTEAPMIIDGKLYFIMTNSLDDLSTEEYDKYLFKEGSTYTLPEIGAEYFIETSTGTRYEPGDSVTVDYSMHFEAVND